MKKNLRSVFLALVIAVPMSLYASGQQKLNAEAHKNDLMPVVEIRLVEFQEIAQEEIPEEMELEEVEIEAEYISLGEFKLTAYCSCEKCCGKWANERPVDEEGNEVVIGASGEILVAGISIAVDKNVIPFGTTVLIDGKTYVAHDCGGAIKKNEIDVYFSDHQEAKEFGVQYAEVFLLKEGENNGT